LSDALHGSAELVAVTGATGWFGSVALDLLYEALGEEAPARVMGYAGAERDVVVSDGRRVRVRPLSDLGFQDPSPTTLVHLAFVTRDKVATLGVDTYISQNSAISAAVIEAVAKHRPRQVVTFSSGAVYSPTGGLVSDLRADPYGALKYADEVGFQAATREVGGVCVIPRVFSVAGARMTKPGEYALGAMITMARAGGPIEVTARGPVFRSYCGVDEVVALALWAAFSGRPVVFDTCGTVVEMGELAQLVAQVHGLDDDRVERTVDPAVPAERYVGDGTVMEGLASEADLSLRPLSTLVSETSAWLTLAREERGSH
jgi:UDP-glucuronate decarboxylase